MLNRRTFFKTTAALSLAARPARLAAMGAAPHITADAWTRLDPPDRKALLMAAIDAARQSGAVYADAQLQLLQTEDWYRFEGLQYPAPREKFTVGIGVRALFNGYWGFAGLSGIPTADAAASLGRAAAREAKIAATGSPRTTDLGKIAVATGTWATPVKADPFMVPPEEKADVIVAMCDYVARRSYGISCIATLQFNKNEQYFASTEGSYTVQTLINSSATFDVGTIRDYATEGNGSRSANFLTPRGAGWEYILEAPFQDRADELIELAWQSARSKPLDLGRYDIILDPEAAAEMLSPTLGVATELDRAMGIHANDVGTSFINDPLNMLGMLQVAAPALTIGCNRSMPGGAATVAWDGEGATPVDTTLIKDGILVDMQTNRESASWLAPYYDRANRPVRTNGCAGSSDPTSVMAQAIPNFSIAPAPNGGTIDDLIRDTKRGLLFSGALAIVDFQALNGMAQGNYAYEIRDGKVGDPVQVAVCTFRTPDFWKSAVAVGGPSTQRDVGVYRYRQGGFVPHTVSSVPVKFRDVAVVDQLRKA